MKRVLALCLSVALLPASAGCLRAVQMDRLGYVMALGFDRGKELPYSVTMLILNTNTEADDQQSGGFTAVRAECSGLYEAIGTLSGILPYRLDLSRVMLMVLSAALAAEQDEAEKLLGVPLTDLQIRYNANVFVSLGDAFDALSGLENKIIPNLSRMITNFVTYADATGLIPATNLMQFREGMQGRAFDAIVPLCGTEDVRNNLFVAHIVGEDGYLGGALPAEGGLKTDAAGAAAFAGGRLVCVLDGQHTQALLMARGMFREGRLRFSMDGHAVSLYLKRAASPETRFSLVPHARAEVTVRLTAMLEDGPKDGAEKAYEMASALLTERAARTFRLCRACGADAFGFGKSAVKCFRTQEAWAAYDWAAAYADMDASFAFIVREDGGRGQ